MYDRSRNYQLVTNSGNYIWYQEALFPDLPSATTTALALLLERQISNLKVGGLSPGSVS